eukprot:9482555-Pyramimonas_sp.AAC.1
MSPRSPWWSPSSFSSGRRQRRPARCRRSSSPSPRSSPPSTSVGRSWSLLPRVPQPTSPVLSPSFVVPL